MPHAVRYNQFWIHYAHQPTVQDILSRYGSEEQGEGGHWDEARVAYQNAICTEIEFTLQDLLEIYVNMKDTQEARNLYIV